MQARATIDSQRLPLTVQTAYSDLLGRLQDDAILDLGGTPVLRERGNRKYWYTVQRLADHTIEKYLGPETKELKERLQKTLELRESQKDREKERSRLARMCREGRVPTVDAQTGKILFALAKSGMFRLRSVLVGTHAFRCYSGILGVNFPEAHAVTEDIDLAAFRSISLALDDSIDPDLEDALQQIGPFIAKPSLHNRTTAWRHTGSEIAVELLTPNQGPDSDEPLKLPTLGAYARPLRFLDYLIHQPIQAAVLYRSGVLVNVPQPARYAVHKLIVATRRAGGTSEKSRKDVEQAATLIRVLAEDRPDELEDAYSEAHGRGRKWREHLQKGVRRLPSDAREALAPAIEQQEINEQARREALDSLPETIDDLIEQLEHSKSDAAIIEWAEALGATTDCAICPATIVSPSTFAEAVIEHYKIEDADDCEIYQRIEVALVQSGVETGGWEDEQLCAYHSDQAMKGD